LLWLLWGLSRCWYPCLLLQSLNFLRILRIMFGTGLSVMNAGPKSSSVNISGLNNDTSVPMNPDVMFDGVSGGARDTSVGIATGYRLDDRSSIPGGGWEFFSSTPCPNRLWGPPSLLSNGYWDLFPCGKAAGAWSWPLASI
jgi:hypothetical protein